MIFAAALYFFISIALVFVERERIQQNGPDVLTIFLLVFGLQNLIPGVVIPFLLSQYSHAPNTGIPLFDRVYRRVSPEEIFLSGVMSAWFVATLYFTYHNIGAWYRSAGRVRQCVRIDIVPWRLWLILALGLVSSLLLLRSMGQGSLMADYRSLIIYRAGSGVAQNVVRSDLLAFTQTFSLISILPIVYLASTPSGVWRSIALGVSVACMVALALMCASRRALPLDCIFIYFTFVIVNKKWHRWFIVLALMMFLPLLIYGKTVLSGLGASGNFSGVISAIESTSVRDALLSGFSYLGISLDSSWATFLFLHIPYRFGVDHILSVLARIPLGSLGLDKAAIYPERVVRISSTAFIDAQTQDIPPGLIGQMWLDYGILGPVLWGLAFGAIMGHLRIRFDAKVITLQSGAYYMLILYILSLPLNSGSFDYVFSIDNFLLVLFLLFIYRRRNSNVGDHSLPSSRARG